MLRSLCFALLLIALAAGSGLAFTAAAAQAAGPPPPALAQAAPPSGGTGDATAAGRQIGEIIKSWGTALLLGVAGLMGVSALIRRNVGEGVTLLVIVLIVGGFVFAPEQVKGFIRAIWSPLAG